MHLKDIGREEVISMGSRGATGGTEKTHQKGRSEGGGYQGRRGSGSRSELTENQKRGNDDFTRRGLGDKMGIVGQFRRGHKTNENEYYKKRFRKRRKKSK